MDQNTTEKTVTPETTAAPKKKSSKGFIIVLALLSFAEPGLVSANTSMANTMKKPMMHK